MATCTTTNNPSKFTNFTRKQGEVFRTTIELQDSDKCPIKLASLGSPSPIHTAFFAGTAVRTLTGTAGTTLGVVAKVPFSFKLKAAETRTTGRGSNTTTETAFYQVEMYIPSDNNEEDIPLVVLGDTYNLNDRVEQSGPTAFFKCNTTTCITVVGVPIVAGTNGWIADTEDLLNFDAPNSTLEMEPGDWTYEIRWSEVANPSSNDTVRCIIQGTLTIEEEVVDLGSSPATFTFGEPDDP